MDRQKALTLVDNERNRQDSKWGPQVHTFPEWYTILGEEFGEVGKAINNYIFDGFDPSNIYNELVHVAAVCVAILESKEEKE